MFYDAICEDGSKYAHKITKEHADQLEAQGLTITPYFGEAEAKTWILTHLDNPTLHLWTTASDITKGTHFWVCYEPGDIPEYPHAQSCPCFVKARTARHLQRFHHVKVVGTPLSNGGKLISLWNAG